MDLEAQRASGRLVPRYEDIAEDGRPRLDMLPVALGIIWRGLFVSKEKRAALRGSGILPILTRFELEGMPGPFSVEAPVDVNGGYEVSHAVDGAGNVARLLLDMEAELWAPKGRTNLPPPEDAGTRALVGRVRAEHVFTRPFAPPQERKVLALPVDGKDFVPAKRRAWRPPIAVLDPPPGARALDGELVHDPLLIALGLTHTDSNQHVNSLAYPHMFEDAALRRMAALGRSTRVLARKLEIAFRKPSFAGETLRVAVRAYEHEGRVVCAGAFFGDGERDVARARVYAQMTFE